MKKSIILIGVIVVIALVGGVTFIGGQWLNARNELSPFGQLSIGFTPAKQLPPINPDVVGVFVRRQDQSVFIGTHIIKWHTVRNPDGSSRREILYDGPEIEIVVTHNTEIFRDTTALPLLGQRTEKAIQQIVEPGTFDDIGAEASVQVWGERQGNRIIARVLVYNYLRF